jgi:hypothetical protein
MYAIKEVAYFIFWTMMFPHNGKIMIIDQVSHYEPNPSTNLDNIIPLIHTNQDAYPLVEMGPWIVITEISSAQGDKNSASSTQKNSHSWHKVNSTAQQKGSKLYKMTKNYKALYTHWA